MGINVNDILVTVCQYLDDEFKASLNTIDSFEQKNQFISKCKYLVEEGWTENFEINNDSSKEENDFFYGSLQNLLNEPHRRIFDSRSDITEQSNPVIIYFARLRLFILVCEVLHKDEKLKNYNDNLSWIDTTKRNLNDEFGALAEKTKMECRGLPLTSLEDLKKTTAEELRARHVTYIKPLLFGTTSVSMGGRYTLNYLFEDNPMLLIWSSCALTFCIIVTGLYILYNQFKLASAWRDLSLFSQRSEQSEAVKVLTDEDIKKFFFGINEEVVPSENVIPQNRAGK